MSNLEKAIGLGKEGARQVTTDGEVCCVCGDSCRVAGHACVVAAVTTLDTIHRHNARVCVEWCDADVARER